MKKISILLVMILMVTGMVTAQTPQTRERKQRDPKEMAQKRTERMAKEYNLSDAQKAQLLELNLAMADKAPKHRHKAAKLRKSGDVAKDQARKPEVSKEEREKRMAEMKKFREDYNNKVKQIFTEDQYNKYQANQAERQKKMTESRKDRQGKKVRV